MYKYNIKLFILQRETANWRSVAVHLIGVTGRSSITTAAKITSIRSAVLSHTKVMRYANTIFSTAIFDHSDTSSCDYMLEVDYQP